MFANTAELAQFVVIFGLLGFGFLIVRVLWRLGSR